MAAMKIFIVAVTALSCFLTVTADYEVGVGIADATGPPVEVNFMGYASIKQNGRGLHLRQFARSFIVKQGDTRIAFVSLDAAMMGIGLRKEVLRQLGNQYGSIYNITNLIISSTHTHSTPGGFMMDLLFDITILGFVQQTFNAYVSGIVRSIQMAHESMVPAKIFYNEGTVENANINRSPTSYLYNPKSERDRYNGDTDKRLVQIKFVANKDNAIIGAINWFAVHPTSMNNTNLLLSSDNVGYASILLEKTLNPPGTFPGKGKVVAAFASTNLGDVSPNIMGPKCEFTGVTCDVHHSTCADKDDHCFASGPGKDMFESTKMIAERISAVGIKLLQTSGGQEITGPIRAVHQFVNMTDISVPNYNPETEEFDTSKTVHGCLPAMGYSFAAGTTDGAGAFNFSQGTTSGNALWDSVRDLLAEPTAEDIKCQYPKPILLATGRIKFPYRWQPDVVSTQLAVIGNLVIAAVPGEFTTMSGRRMRSVLTKTFKNAGKDVKVVVAGLCNTYSDYITTPEEYEPQRYEAASTIYGPHTLTIHLNQFNKLAKAIIENDSVDKGPTPTDFSKDLISLVTPVIFDMAPWDHSFGDCVLQPRENYTRGDIVRVKFISGNPRNNLMTEKTYLAVEKYNTDTSAWEVVATDSHWETRFMWERTSMILGTSRVNIYWEIGNSPKGTYRIKHYGYFKYILGATKSYQGSTRTFNVY